MNQDNSIKNNIFSIENLTNEIEKEDEDKKPSFNSLLNARKKRNKELSMIRKREAKIDEMKIIKRVFRDDDEDSKFWNSL